MQNCANLKFLSWGSFVVRVKKDFESSSIPGHC